MEDNRTYCTRSHWPQDKQTRDCDILWWNTILFKFQYTPHQYFWLSSILVVFHFGRLPFWSSPILVVFPFGRLPFWSSSILVVFHFGRLPFWSSSILVVFHFGCLPFCLS